MHEKLLDIIKLYIPISEKEFELCYTYFESINFNKKSIIEEAGKIPIYLYFVVSGYVRLFYFNENGDEITTHINCPPGFITSYINFINQTKSNENLERITDCELLRITKKNLDFIIAKSTGFKDFSISIFQQSIAYNEIRSNELATLTAEQRYKKLINNYPHVIQNVPLQYIASFLGINSKSLSRIRKQIIK
jgi:CRP/FNR family transcriptional regulator, anaerobic regulatory protein